MVRYDPVTANVFNNVDIKGGVAICMRNAKADYGRIVSYTSHKELATILRKVMNHDGFASIDTEIRLQNKFNLEALYANHPDCRSVVGSGGRERRLTTSIFNQLEVFTEERKGEDDIAILGLVDNNRIYKYVSRKYIEDNGNLHKYKVVLPKSNGSGAIGEVLSTPLIGEPMIGYTQSFIGIGSFDTEAEAAACLKYVKTKFMRTMLGTLKVTQDNPSDTWANVPLQDFTPASDIDWSQPIAAIDRQLYAKYGLTDDEVAFIERMIKPME